VDWDALAADYDRIRDRIAGCSPASATSTAGCASRAASCCATRRRTGSGTPKAGGPSSRWSPCRIRLPEGQLRLFTIRSHDQYNTTIYGLDDRYRGIRGARRVVFMHPDDLAERGLADGDEVDVRSHAADGRDRVAPRFRAVAYDVPRGCGAAYFPEANVLVPIGSTARGATPRRPRWCR
jgi:anaerobic selenocysteine-containing dehydrogenase